MEREKRRRSGLVVGALVAAGAAFWPRRLLPQLSVGLARPPDAAAREAAALAVRPARHSASDAAGRVAVDDTDPIGREGRALPPPARLRPLVPGSGDLRAPRWQPTERPSARA